MPSRNSADQRCTEKVFVVSKDNLNFGKRGENAAADFLKRNGCKILKRNYRNKFGEIDIIAKDKDTLCFVEVKARSSLLFGLPQESVNIFKQNQMAKAALIFLKENKLLEEKARFDVISVINTEQEPRISLIKNAFELDERFTV